MNTLPAKDFFFDELFENYQSLPALVSENGSITYRQFYRIIRETAVRLRRHGVDNGERVAILTDIPEAWPVLFPALWHAGAAAVPLSTRWPAAEIEARMADINCRKIIVSEKEKFTGQLSGVEKLPLEPLLQDLPEIFRDDPVPAHRPEPSAARTPGGLERRIAALPDEPATVIFTSGSSGQSKAVVHSLRSHLYNALGSNENITLTPGDRWLLSLPAYHVGGLAILLRCFLAGAAVALKNPDRPPGEIVRKLKVTHLSLVPTQLQRLLREEEAGSLKTVKAILLGGSAIPENLIREAVRKKLPVFTSYGSTEMGSQVATTPPGDSPEHLLTAGRVLRCRLVKISGDGEILVAGRTLFRGYQSGDSLQPAVTEDGWFRSGDLGRFTGDGYLVVTGRKDNMFISGGENIQPEEIEHYLKRLAGVLDAVVVPVADETFGERPVAFVRLAGGNSPDEKALRRQLERVLPRFKIPDRFYPWPRLKESRSIKTDRKALREYARRLPDRNSAGD